jgi:type II secretory pathway pseudopilin PulG
MAPALPTIRRRKEAGYTLLLVVFLVATMILVASAAAPNLLTEGRRQKEDEMIWRGNQYARAFRLYFAKFRKFPTKIEDLTNQTNGVRFLRQAYKDPMNKEDGSWRFIYVGPNGQLIGSLRQTSLLQNAVGSVVPGASPFGPMAQPQSPFVTGTAGQQPGTGALGVSGASTQNPNSIESQPQPLTSDVIGGNIIGVGSKVKKPSLRVYQGADTYEEWEFIWNPLGQVAGPGQNQANPGIGQNPNGQPTVAPGTVPPQPPPATQ